MRTVFFNERVPVYSHMYHSILLCTRLGGGTLLLGNGDQLRRIGSSPDEIPEHVSGGRRVHRGRGRGERAHPADGGHELQVEDVAVGELGRAADVLVQGFGSGVAVAQVAALGGHGRCVQVGVRRRVAHGKDVGVDDAVARRRDVHKAGQFAVHLHVGADLVVAARARRWRRRRGRWVRRRGG